MRRYAITTTYLAGFVLLAAAGLLTACGDGSGGSDPTPTAEPFDRQLLTAAVLRPEDIGPGYTASGQFATGSGPSGAQSFTTIAIDGARRVHSTTIHYTDRAKQREDFIDDRAALVNFQHTESNYQVNGADQAFFYRTSSLPTLSMWAIKDEYIVFLQTSVLVNARDAIDRTTFDNLATLLMERVSALDADPSSVTPVSELESVPEMFADATRAPAATGTPGAGTAEPTTTP